MVGPATAADDTEAPPKRRASKKSLLLPLLLGGFGLIIFGCGGLALADYFFFHFLLGGGGIGSEQKYFPDRTQFVASVKVDEMLTSDSFKKLKNEVDEIKKALEA